MAIKFIAYDFVDEIDFIFDDKIDSQCEISGDINCKFGFTTTKEKISQFREYAKKNDGNFEITSEEKISQFKKYLEKNGGNFDITSEEKSCSIKGKIYANDVINDFTFSFSFDANIIIV